jgi:hypothetical protein
MNHNARGLDYNLVLQAFLFHFACTLPVAIRRKYRDLAGLRTYCLYTFISIAPDVESAMNGMAKYETSRHIFSDMTVLNAEDEGSTFFRSIPPN